MKFFQKRGVAIAITLLLIAAALLIGKPWVSQSTSSVSASGNDYLNYIADDANVLTNDTRGKITDDLEKLDGNYNSIVALMTVSDTDGEDIDDYAEQVWEDADFLSSDMLLVVNASNGDWYLYPGSEIEPYLDASLKSLCTEHLDDADFTDGGKWAVGLYKDLLSWYGKSIPQAGSSAPRATYESSPAPRRSLWKTLLIILIVVLVLKAIFSRPRHDDDDDYRGGSSGGSGGFWKGMFWGSLLGGGRRRRWAPPPPPPHGGPRPGGPGPRPGPRPGGFGGGSRGGFGGGSRGGFGGGSRGGFGGGSRGGFGGGRR